MLFITREEITLESEWFAAAIIGVEFKDATELAFMRGMAMERKPGMLFRGHLRCFAALWPAGPDRSRPAVTPPSGKQRKNSIVLGAQRQKEVGHSSLSALNLAAAGPRIQNMAGR